MKKVSVKEIILSAAERLDDSIMQDIPLLVKWSKDVENKIGSKYSHPVDAKAFEVDGCYVEMSDEMFSILRVYLGDVSSQCNLLISEYNEVLYPSLNVIGDYIYTNLNGVEVDPQLYTVKDNSVWFVDDMNGNTITLIYEHLKTDTEGYPIVNESHSDALIYYFMYRDLERYKYKKYKQKKLTNIDLAYPGQVEREYHREVRNARAQDIREYELERSRY